MRDSLDGGPALSASSRDSERLRQRLEELVRSYDVEIVGKVWRALDAFCEKEEIEAKKVGEGQESYCAKLNDLFLAVVLTTVGDTRKIITLFPTNRRATWRGSAEVSTL